MSHRTIQENAHVFCGSMSRIFTSIITSKVISGSVLVLDKCLTFGSLYVKLLRLGLFFAKKRKKEGFKPADTG